MLNYFVLDGKPSSDFGVYIGGQDTFGSPQRDVSKVSIQGRNGDLVRDNGRWLNITIPYNIVIMDNFQDKADAFNAWLASKRGYVRLEDTYHPNHFRLANFSSGMTYKTATFNDAGRGRVQFDCKPQRFLKSGETENSFITNGWLYNPTLFESNPLITIVSTGTGTVTVNGTTITITNYTGTVIVDSELQDCYNSTHTQNLNSYVSLSSGKFPKLISGGNAVALSGDITSVSIAGRWYDI